MAGVTQSYMNIKFHNAPQDAISGDAVAQGTTLMFRHLPRKYTARDLEAILEQHVTSAAFDFVYVPWDRNSSSNMAYAFVNFVDLPTARMITATMNGSIWPNDPRMREMKIIPAKLQGFEANLMRYYNSVADPVLSHCPLIFRKGQQMPFQAAVQDVVQAQAAAQWHFKESFMQSGYPAAPAHSMVVRPPPGLPAPIQDMDLWSVASSSDGSLPPLSAGACQSEMMSSACHGKRLDSSSFPSAVSTASTASTESTITRQLESPYQDAVLESPAYAAASLKVDDLLMKLRQAGAF